jgi:hypothetical protein
VLVLCLTWAEHTPSIDEEKASERRKWFGFLVDVCFWSALTLTLNQRVRGCSAMPGFELNSPSREFFVRSI